MTRRKDSPLLEQIERILRDAGIDEKHLPWMIVSCPSVAAAKAYAAGRARRAAEGP